MAGRHGGAVEQQGAVGRQAVQANVGQALGGIGVVEGEVGRAQRDGRVLWRHPARIGAVGGAVGPHVDGQRAAGAAALAVACRVGDHDGPSDVQRRCEAQTVVRVDRHRAQRRIHRGRQHVQRVGVDVKVVGQHGNVGNRRVQRRRGRVVDHHRRVVDGVDRQADAGRRGATVAVNDGVAEAGRAVVVGRRGEHHVGTGQADRAAQRALHAGNGQGVAICIAVVDQQTGLADHCWRVFVGRGDRVVDGQRRVVDRRDVERHAVGIGQRHACAVGGHHRQCVGTVEVQVAPVAQGGQCRVDLGLRARQGQARAAVDPGADGGTIEVGDGDVAVAHRQACVGQVAVDVVDAQAADGQADVFGSSLGARHSVNRGVVDRNDGDGRDRRVRRKSPIIHRDIDHPRRGVGIFRGIGESDLLNRISILSLCEGARQRDRNRSRAGDHGKTHTRWQSSNNQLIASLGVGQQDRSALNIDVAGVEDGAVGICYSDWRTALSKGCSPVVIYSARIGCSGRRGLGAGDNNIVNRNIILA